MKKTNISNLLQSISVLATLRVIVNGNYSTILKHLQQKLTNYSIYYFSIYKFDYKKKKEEENKEKFQFNEQNEKFQFNQLIQHVPKKKYLWITLARIAVAEINDGTRRKKEWCHLWNCVSSHCIAIRATYDTKKKEEKKKNDKIGLHRWPKEVTWFLQEGRGNK